MCMKCLPIDVRPRFGCAERKNSFAKYTFFSYSKIYGFVGAFKNLNCGRGLRERYG